MPKAEEHYREMFTMIVDARTQEVQKRTDKLKIACRKMAQINPLYNVFLASGTDAVSSDSVTIRDFTDTKKFLRKVSLDWNIRSRW